ncbi:MAG: hypothetical protein KF791_15675 [Verrucomicrobiae bacterium]|nr:hypothetical protein [Verrucomicrobiae bacterium]
MSGDIAHPPIAEQSWFREILEAHGFERTGPGEYSNGRASLRITGSRLTAIPAEGGRPWRSDLTGAQPEAVRTLLSAVLAAPSFQSAAHMEAAAVARSKAEVALSQTADTIARDPDTHSAVHLRRFLCSLYNGHHPVSLWRLKDVLDSHHNAAVVEVFTAWMQGHVPEAALRRALTASGEMDRWDTVKLGAKDRERLGDALGAVTDLVNTVSPGRPTFELTRANGLLRQVVD